MSELDILSIKKRLMFVKGEDFYFLTYNMCVLLDALGCTGMKKPFKDHRKLAFLIDFVADAKLITIVEQAKVNGNAPRPRDRQELVQAYSNGASRVHLISRLICAMALRGLLTIVREGDSLAANVYLNPEAMPTDFLSGDMYAEERQNVVSLLQLNKLVRTTTLGAVLKSLFDESGVTTWHA